MLQQQLAWKRKLRETCTLIIQERITRARSMMAATQDAANQEEKSSAGDKYETSRAMGHLEKDMHARQLAEYMKELAALHAIDTDIIYSSVLPGAYLTCTLNNFFILAGLGKQQVDGNTIIFLSPHAPLAAAMSGKKKDDVFNFNGKQERIVDLF